MWEKAPVDALATGAQQFLLPVVSVLAIMTAPSSWAITRARNTLAAPAPCVNSSSAVASSSLIQDVPCA